MDGLELIAESRRGGTACDFIVLSGFSEFAYAQRATEYGVRSYMLKPIDQKELSAKIEELQAEWERSREQLARRALLQRMQLERELQRMFQSGSYPDQGSSAYAMLASQLCLPWKSYCVTLIGDERRLLEVSEWLRDALDAAGLRGCSGKYGVIFPYGPYVAVVTDEPIHAAQLSDCLAEVESAYPSRLVASKGHEVARAEQLPESYLAANQAMRDRFFYDRSDRMLLRDMRLLQRKEGLQENEPSMPGAKIAEAAQAIATGQPETFREVLEAITEAMLRSAWEEQQIRASFIATYSGVLSRLSAIDDQISTLSAPLHVIVKEVEAAHSLLEARSCIEAQLLSCMDEWMKSRKNENFIAMLEYIAEHYDSELRLETLAEAFHYNKSYLGKLFKAQTGENFSSYLDRIRLDKAKLLLAGGAKVYEAASRVGYGSVDYFHLKFKKIVGESPSTYRDRWTQ